MKIIAKFQLDAKKKPQFENDGDHKHYAIELAVEGVPEDTYAVTYELDESYYDPTRESREKSSNFSEEITSYGDYIVKAKIRTRSGVETIAAALSKVLQESYGKIKVKEIKRALKDIEDN